MNSAFVLSGDRLGEDLLATDLLAFDVRAYDPSAPIIEYNGLTLRPGDPGFGTVGLPGLTTSPPQSSIAAYGEFVDLNWAGKLNINYASELSGRDAGGISSTLYRSGLALGPNGSQIFQPSYDTFTNLFESDGILQAELANRGLVQFSPMATPGASLLREGWRSTASDAGTDGIDNNPLVFPGIDDSSELESSPPFPVHLRGLQISIRLEDSGRKQFKQMSTVKEFVTN